MKRVTVGVASLLNRFPVGVDGVAPSAVLAVVPQLSAFLNEYHQRFDLFLATALSQSPEAVRCGAGCSNCCHHFPMSTEPFELLGLYMELRKRPDFFEVLEQCQHRVRTYMDLFRAAQKTMEEEEAEDHALHEYFTQGLSCPFLEEATGNCGIHAIRPGTCRMYFSFSDPALCVPESLGKPENRAFILQLPDELEETLYELGGRFSQWDLPESLYGGLLALNALEGEMGL